MHPLRRVSRKPHATHLYGGYRARRSDVGGILNPSTLDSNANAVDLRGTTKTAVDLGSPQKPDRWSTRQYSRGVRSARSAGGRAASSGF
jgi:hypothetical protein